MGFRQTVDSADYAAFECPDGSAIFSLHAVDELLVKSQVSALANQPLTAAWLPGQPGSPALVKSMASPVSSSVFRPAMT